MSSRFPFPLEKGDKLRLFHQLRLLSTQYDITLCSIVEQQPTAQEKSEVLKYCKNIYILKISIWRIAFHLFIAIFSGLPMQIAYFYDKKIEHNLLKIIKKEEPDVIFCQLIRCASYVQNLPSRTPKVLDYMDAFSSGLFRRAAYSKNYIIKFLLTFEAKRLARFEEKAFAWFDAHTIISTQDAEALTFASKQKIQVVPNGVVTDFFKNDAAKTPNYDLIFVGNLGYAPNIEAAKLLVKNILPIIENRLNRKIRLLICGARPSASVLALQNERVRVLPNVSDIRTAYSAGRVFVAPLFTGSGQQNKILEAMSMELPCVTTTLVNNAIGAAVGNTILVANTDEAFANAAIFLLENEATAQEMGKAARRFVLEKYAWEYSVSILFNIFKHL